MPWGQVYWDTPKAFESFELEHLASYRRQAAFPGPVMIKLMGLSPK